MRRLLLCLPLLCCAAAALALPAEAITRDQVLARARAYAYHPWRCTTQNLTASCAASYKSVYIPGDYVGLPYDWGGYMTLFEFDQQIAKGFGAGSYASDGVLSCTAGLDCSGFVSKCWDAGHWSTSTLHNVSSPTTQAALLPGDAYNKAGSHVVLYSHKLASGEPIWYEAGGYNTHITVHSGWSNVTGFSPIRYDKITGSSAGNPQGTTQNPIVINALPYTDARDTSSSDSDSIDGCGAAPTKDESGPEFIYKVSFTKPGTVTIQTTDDVGADIDPHLFGSLNTSDCLARHDSALSHPVDCGTYYIVVDSFGGKAGKYTLKVSFTATAGKACGSGPAAYAPKGAMGDSCAYPSNKNLPFCNANLGATTCIYGTSSSFCSKPCKGNGDCTAFSGGCCKDINGKGEYYCMLASFCAGQKLDAGVKADTGAGSDGPSPQSDAAPGSEAGAADDGSSTTSEAGTSGDGAPPPDEGDDDSGCSCRVQRTGDGGAAAAGLAALLLLGLLRRRSS
jgi:MYXO-CTERM domain-containing protein